MHDRHLHDAAPRPHALGGERDRAQVPRDLGVPGATRVRQDKSAALPLGQRKAEVCFEHAQLLAHRRGRDRQFLSCRAHRAQARDGVERPDGI